MMRKTIAKLLLIIVVGGLAGIFGCELFLPWLAGFSFFSKFDWIRHSREGVTVINQTEQVFVTQDNALQDAIAKAGKSVVLVLAERTEKIVNNKKIALVMPEIVAQSTGLIVSSDGLVLASQAVVTAEAQKIEVILEEKRVEAQIEKQDKDSGLVLLKISENNLPVLPFAENRPKLGETIFLIGAQSINDSMTTFVDISYIKQITPALAAGFLEQDVTGSPIFNIKAETEGIWLVVSGSQTKIVEAGQIKSLLD